MDSYVLRLLLTAIFLFIFERIYFLVAIFYKILDKPNERSSHSVTTIRGGGIIFPVSILLYAIFFNWSAPFFLSGLLLISFVSFVDDIHPVSSKVRLMIHVLSVLLLSYQLSLFEFNLLFSAILLVIGIGIINAINFMDGINGITGAYAFITLLTLGFIDKYVLNFVDINFILVATISSLIFLVFNFRKRATCFAGDVGSVGIAFILLFLLTKLILTSGTGIYILMLFVYGLDTVTTIIFRISRKENIFLPHRSHFYQFLVNTKGYSHLWVTSLYAVAQLILNLILLSLSSYSSMIVITIFGLIAVLFLFIRFRLEGRKALLGVISN